jgi:hypothetical protein
MENLTVLIGSCDEYSFLWENFDTLFKRYWKLNTKNIIVSETIKFDNEDYKTITPGKKSWGHRILESLNEVDTEYVFFILDDYYLTENFDEKLIDDHIKIMNDYGAVKIMIDIDYEEPIYSLEHINGSLYKFKSESQYLNSVQPSIWKTDYLKKVLKPEYSPWDFETIGNEFTKKLNPLILINVIKDHMYFNVLRQGCIKAGGWEYIFTKENLKF